MKRRDGGRIKYGVRESIRGAAMVEGTAEEQKMRLEGHNPVTEMEPLCWVYKTLN